MNQLCLTQEEEILEKLKNCKLKELQVKELSLKINEIFQAKQQYKNYNTISKANQLEKKLVQITEQLTELILQTKKKEYMFKKLFKWDQHITRLQQNICSEIQLLHIEVNGQNENSQFITKSDFFLQKQVINEDLIIIPTKIKIHHPKLFQIKSEIQLIFKQGQNSDQFEFRVKISDLMSKIKVKSQNLDENQQKYLDQFNKNQTQAFFFLADYSRNTKTVSIFSNIHPYVITDFEKQQKIYLCSGMKLKFFPNQILVVMETNTSNQDLTDFSTQIQQENQNFQNKIIISDYGYIKFCRLQNDSRMSKQDSNLNTEQSQQQQNIFGIGETYEFYLKNSHLQLADYIPLINATLFHDQNGFYLLPIKKTNTRNYYLLYYEEWLQTKSNKFSFGLQIKGKGWIFVETDNENIEYVNL